MPNYSHGTKLTLASAEEPPYLTVGTDVSAKYKGAFCEAKIIDVNKNVKLRVLFDGISGSYLIDDTDVKAGSTMETGSKIEAKHPSKKKQQIYAQATISKILDHSRYTVIFDDGDQCILRRNSICLKSGKHFAESETLDQLPLTNPEHFGNPVKVGAYEQQQLQISQRDQQQSVTKNDINTTQSSGPNHSNSGGRSQANIKQETPSSTSDKSKVVEVAPSSASGRRGAKGRKRRESVTNKHDLDDGSMDSSQDSTDIDPVNSNVKFDTIAIGVKLMIQYGKGKIQNVYEAKVNKIETNPNGRIRYFVHYTGWNNRYDEWVTRNRIVSIVTEKENGRDGRSRQPEPIPMESYAYTATSSSSNQSTKEKEKEKEKELERKREREKEKEREKELEIARQKERQKEMEKEKERQKELERQREKERELEREKERLKEEERKRELEKEQERLKKEQKEKEEERKRELEKELEKEKEKERLKEKEKEKDRKKAKEKDALTKTRRSRKSEVVTATIASSPVSTNQPNEFPPNNQTPQPVNKPGRSGSVGRQQRQRGVNSTTLVSTTGTPTVTISTEPTTNKTASSSLSTTQTATASTSSGDTASKQEEITRGTGQTEMDVDSEPVEPGKADDKKKSDFKNEPPKPFKSYMKSMNFCSEITEQDCDKKISILQERIIELRQFYLMLKSGLADLERRRKRPRTESA